MASRRGGPRSTRSHVWTDFQKSKDGKHVACKLCVDGDWKPGDKGVLAYKSGSTTMMHEHLKRVHGMHIDTPQSASGGGSTQRKITSFAVPSPSTRTPCSPATQKFITDLLADWIIGDLRPLNVANDKGFKRLIMFLAPNYAPI